MAERGFNSGEGEQPQVSNWKGGAESFHGQISRTNHGAGTTDDLLKSLADIRATAGWKAVSRAAEAGKGGAGCMKVGRFGLSRTDDRGGGCQRDHGQPKRAASGRCSPGARSWRTPSEGTAMRTIARIGEPRVFRRRPAGWGRGRDATGCCWRSCLAPIDVQATHHWCRANGGVK